MKEKQIRVRNGQVSINYLQSGDGDTTILFLHGWCVSSKYWANQLSHLSGYRCYAIDLPGFGKSEAKREHWTIEEYALDALAFINELQLENVVVVGHSMSGAIMMEMALTKPDSIIGLVGIDNFKFVDVEFTAEQLEQMGSFFPLLEQDFQTYAPIYAENMLFHPSTTEEVKSRVKLDFSTANPGIGYSSFMNLMQYSQQERIKLESLPLKLYLINTDFPPTNESGLKKRCKNGFEVQPIELSGHYPMIERPDLFNNILEKTLQELLEPEMAQQ
ncbi:MAG: alpha/beta hydrolase [Imperialibacter sp.]|uniref:alpha/beta fold hydrolase n=1 Tax=Imperialibacter sp. TaxID=2038411 RepID=UPI0032EEC114